MATTLLLVDLQNEFLSSTGNFPIDAVCQQALLENVSKAVQAFRDSGDAVPVVWVRSEYSGTTESPPRGDSAKTQFLQGTHTGKTPCCEANSFGAEFPNSVDQLRQPQDLVVTKTRYSAFTDTTLRDELTARNVTDIYVGGLLTNVCVRATAEAAHALGFAVTVLEDCLGWRKYKSHQAALRGMREGGIRTATRAEILGVSPQEPVLYCVNGSIPSWRVLMALYEKEISFTAKRLRVMCDPKQTRSPTFLELNHRGKTPVFIDPLPERDEKVTINESLAILQYIETYHRPEQPLLPLVSQRSARALALARMQESENLHNIYDALEDAHFGAEKAGEPLHLNERAELVAKVHAELDYWETVLFFPLLGYMVHRGFDWSRPVEEGESAADAWPHLRAYFERVREKGSARRAQPAGWDRQGRENVWTGMRGK
ncbi:Isochorismatase-like protein [Mycena filopes]|nr:Isochorismatase-like protein [Mycena filopes]